MTVQDLMRHTAGLVYGTRGTSLVYQAYRDAKIGDRGATNEEFVARLSKMPLNFNPGDRWEYSVAVDVQGRLLEVPGRQAAAARCWPSASSSRSA